MNWIGWTDEIIDTRTRYGPGGSLDMVGCPGVDILEEDVTSMEARKNREIAHLVETQCNEFAPLVLHVNLRIVISRDSSSLLRTSGRLKSSSDGFGFPTQSW